MKLLHLRTLSDSGGGPEKTIFNVCKYHNDSGDILAEIAYIIDPMTVDKNRLEKKARAAGSKLFIVEENHPLSLKTLRTLKEILDVGRYDVVHSHDYKTNLVAGLFKKHFGYKFVVSIHGYNATTFRERIYYQFDRISLKKADVVVTPGRCLAEELKSKLGLKDVRVIYNGIDLNKWAFFESNKSDYSCPIELLYVGRLSAEKNVELLIDACSILKNEFEIRLTLAGTGESYAELRNRVSEKGLVENVEFAGFVSQNDVYDLLTRCDIFVLPSKTEVLPNSLLEAMAVGVPVIASDVGSVSELIRDGKEGLLFKSGNVNELTEKIRQLILDFAFGCRLAYSARKRIESDFTFDMYLNKTIDLYESLFLPAV